MSYGLLNKLQYNPVLGYFVMIYRFVLRPLFASRLDSSPHNFGGCLAGVRSTSDSKEILSYCRSPGTKDRISGEEYPGVEEAL